MAELINVVLIVLCINACLFIGQAMIINANPESPQLIKYDFHNSPICSADQKNCADINNATLNKALAENQSNYPEVSVIGQIGATVLGGIGDMFTGLKNWFFNDSPVAYLLKILSAPFDFLIMAGVPPAMAMGIGAIWYLLTIFLMVNWWKGGFA